MDLTAGLVAFRWLLVAIAGTAIGPLLTPPYLLTTWPLAGFGLLAVGVASSIALRHSFQAHGGLQLPGAAVAAASWLLVFCPALPVLFVVWPQLLLAWGAIAIGALTAVTAAVADRDLRSVTVALVLSVATVAAPLSYTDLFLAGVEARVRIVAPHYEAAVEALLDGDVEGAELPDSSPVTSDPLRVGWIWHGGVLDNVAGPVYAEDDLDEEDERQLFPDGRDAGLFGDCQHLFGHWYFCVFT